MKPGEEALYVMATLRPLHESDRELAAQLGLLPRPTMRGLGDAMTAPPPPPPPRPIRTSERGVRLGGESDPVQRVESDQAGVAVLRFAFRHLPRTP